MAMNNLMQRLVQLSVPVNNRKNTGTLAATLGNKQEIEEAAPK
jgi:hypothetical protein